MTQLGEHPCVTQPPSAIWASHRGLICSFLFSLAVRGHDVMRREKFHSRPESPVLLSSFLKFLCPLDLFLFSSSCSLLLSHTFFFFSSSCGCPTCRLLLFSSQALISLDLSSSFLSVCCFFLVCWLLSRRLVHVFPPPRQALIFPQPVQFFLVSLLASFLSICWLLSRQSAGFSRQSTGSFSSTCSRLSPPPAHSSLAVSCAFCLRVSRTADRSSRQPG